MERDEDYNISETGNWNVAARYSDSKIMKPLILADIYEDVAYFGYSDFLEQLQELNVPTDVLKLTGFERLIRILIRIIDNSTFAIKVSKKQQESEKNDRSLLNGYRAKLEKIQKIIPLLKRNIRDNIKKTQTIKLKEPEYSKVLEEVIRIKALINEPLNNHDLIFTNKSEFDPRAFKERLKDRMVNRG